MTQSEKINHIRQEWEKLSNQQKMLSLKKVIEGPHGQSLIFSRSDLYLYEATEPNFPDTPVFKEMLSVLPSFPRQP